jgi:DHA2 family multidrug resistance protein-like MFS transporter
MVCRINHMFELRPPSPRAGAREWASLAVLVLAVTLLAVDATVLSLAIPSLSESLAPSANQILWIGDIYSFAIAGLLITMGNVADRVGRKKLLLTGSIAFGISSAIAAFAPTAEVLIAARALLGISGATLMPSTLSIIRHMFRVPAQRTRAIAIWSAGAAGGAALGPLVGGVLLEHFWWGSVFLINIPVIVVLVVAGLLLLPESRNPNAQSIDWFSSALSIAAIVPLIYAVKSAFSGDFGVVMHAAAALGIVAGWWFVRRQRRLTTPLFDLELFALPAFRGAVISNGMAIFALSGLLFFSQYLQLVRGLSPLQAGLTELPATLASMVVVLLIGAVVGRLGMGGTIGIGLIVAGIGLAGLALAESLPGYVAIIATLLVVGFGIGLAITVSTDAVVGSVPRARAGAASGISETAYELGTALGIAILGSIMTALYRVFLPGLESLPEAAPAVAEGLRLAFTHGMQVTALIAAGILVVTGIFAWRTIPRRFEVSEDTGMLEVIEQ